MPMMCFPGGASDGSYMVGTVSSSSGDCDGRPYLASSQARSTYSIEGQMCIVARCCGPFVPGRARKLGSPLRARLILHEVPSLRYLRMLARKSAGSSRDSTRLKNVE